MTFKEAKEKREFVGDTYTLKTGHKARPIVVPKNDDDYHAYCEDFRRGGFTDETAKRYSRDNQYDVYALFFDGANILASKVQ